MANKFFLSVAALLFTAMTAFGQDSEVYDVNVAEPGTFAADCVPGDVTRLKITGKLDLPNDCVELYKLLSERYIEELDLTGATFQRCDTVVELPSTGWYTYNLTCYEDNSFPVGLFRGLGFGGKLVMPSTLKSVKKDTFYGDDALGRGSEVVFSEGLDSLGQDAFCFSRIEKITLPKSLKYVGSGCFYNNEYLNQLYLPDDIEEVDDSLFANCPELEHVHLPKALKRIQWWSISGIFKTLTIPTGVEYVGCEALNGCYWLEELHCLPVVPPACGHDTPYSEGVPQETFNSILTDNVILYVPKGSVEAYRNADGWNAFKDIREEADDYEEDLSWYDDGAASIGGVSVGKPAATSVDVFTLQGVCVKRNVAPGSWADGLAKGVYIVGGEKCIVR